MHTVLRDPLEILIVDDDEVDRMALKRALKGTGFVVSMSEANDAESALKSLREGEFNCVFLDYNLPGRNGLELAKQIRQQGIRVPLIVLTGQGNEQTAVELMKAGASDYLPKSKLSSEAIARLMRSSIQMHTAENIVEKANQTLRANNRLLEQQNKELARQRRYIYQQNLQLQEVSRLKSEFLATMSHELRTPLNAVIGFSQILLSKAKGPLSERQDDMISRILANGRNLLELINDILAFSKIEAGRMALDPAKFDIAKLVNTTVKELQSLAAQKSLALKTSIDIENPIVTNDAVRMRQILVNLISNAIKFTDTGSVQISLKALAVQADEPERLSIAVADTGCGISENDKVYIFDPFHQADQKVTRRHAGTGLGLAITHSLVKMMNGSIQVDSQLNRGSTFSVELPREVTGEKDISFEELVYSNARLEDIEAEAVETEAVKTKAAEASFDETEADVAKLDVKATR
ncbi:MAG: ATP-binding protein [Phormidesmis sp.]